MRCMGVHVCVVCQDNKSVAFFLRNVYIVFHFTIMIIMKSRSFHALWLQQNSHHLAEIFKLIFLKWKLLYLDINVNEGCHYGNQSQGYLIGGRLLWPPAVPRLAARSSQSNPRGLGQRYWSVSAVTWPPKLELRRSGSSGPSSLMSQWFNWW